MLSLTIYDGDGVKLGQQFGPAILMRIERHPTHNDRFRVIIDAPKDVEVQRINAAYLDEAWGPCPPREAK